MYNKVKDAKLPYPLIPWGDVWQLYKNEMWKVSVDRIPMPTSLALDLYTEGRPDQPATDELGIEFKFW